MAGLQASHVVAAFLELNHSLTLRAALPFLLLGQVSQFLVPGSVSVLHICPKLAASHVCVPRGVALHAEAAVTCPAFHEPTPPATGFLHEGRAILEGAVDLLRGGDGGFRLPSGENLEACWGEELTALMDVEIVTAVLVRTLDLGASGCDLPLRIKLATMKAVLVVTPCQTSEQKINELFD